MWAEKKNDVGCGKREREKKGYEPRDREINVGCGQRKRMMLDVGREKERERCWKWAKKRNMNPKYY